MIRYQLDSDFSILVMESGASVTISDALKYLNLDVKIPAQLDVEKDPEDEEEEKPATEAADDDPALPQSLCQVCLESIQSSYEFKFRCEENRNFLKSYLKEISDSKLAEERAVKEAALAALDLDLDNLDNLPDKLVLKTIIKEKKPRKQRDPAKPPVMRKRKIQERNIIIAEDSQVESTAYIRKVNTPEQSPDQPRGNKRKSKHVVIEDIFVGSNSGKKVEAKKEKTAKENVTESPIASVEEPASKKAKTEPKKSIQDEEPIFEDDDDDLKPKRSTRKK